MPLVESFQSSFTLFAMGFARLVRVWIWMMGARFRVLRKAAGWRKSARKAAQKLERETTKRLQRERELAEAKAARDVAQQMLQEYMERTQSYLQEVTQWAGRQAVGYGPGEAIPEHLVKGPVQEAKAPKLSARQMAEPAMPRWPAT